MPDFNQEYLDAKTRMRNAIAFMCYTISVLMLLSGAASIILLCMAINQATRGW